MLVWRRLGNASPNTQVCHTPLLSTLMLDLFGKCGQTKAFQQVLSRNFLPPPDCDWHMAQFLAQVQCPVIINNIPKQSTQAYCHGWQRAWESTRSSASRINFGHYIASTFNPEILVVNATLANIPLCTSFTYNLWKKGVNVMIEKKCGDFNYKLYSCLKQTLMQIINGLATRSCTKQNGITY